MDRNPLDNGRVLHVFEDVRGCQPPTHPPLHSLDQETPLEDRINSPQFLSRVCFFLSKAKGKNEQRDTLQQDCLVVSTPLKNIRQKWESSLNRDENKTYLKPPPRRGIVEKGNPLKQKRFQEQK